MFFLSLSVLTGLVVLIPLGTLRIPDIGVADLQLILGIVAVVLSLITTYFLRASVYRASEERERTQQRLRKKLFELREADFINMLSKYPQLLSDIIRMEVDEINLEPQVGKMRPDLFVRGANDEHVIVELASKDLDKDNIQRMHDYLTEYWRDHSEEVELIGFLIELSGSRLDVSKIENQNVQKKYRIDIIDLVSKYPDITFGEYFDL